MRRISLLVITILLLSGLAGFGEELESREGFDSPFGFMPAEFDFEHARRAGAYWDRPFFELFEWGMIEPEQGRFNFHLTDRYILRAQSHGFHVLANIQPFARWDQKLCHQDLPVVMSPMGPQTKGKPCNIEAYKNFVIKLVERYDGDGQDDMPGLKYPIKCWEVANEPEMQREPLVFFQGSPQDYFEILKATHEAVKEADSEAQVIQGGMAGMDRWMVSFWQKVFDLGAASYFDIANIHSIGHGEHLNIPSFKKFLSQNNASEKPFWVTEVQIEDRKRKRTPAEYAASLARSYIFALANGAKKIFYVNLRLPEHLPPEEEGGPGFSDLSTLVDSSGNLTPLFYAHCTIASKLEDFQRVEKIKERVRGRTILEGRYRFLKNNKAVYVLWGRGKLPSEIEGKVRVTDISGSEEILTSDSIRLTSSPVFVEKIEPPSETLTVIQVIDGDTCLLEDGQLIRYLGINAPQRDEALFEEVRPSTP
ncbi:MAG: hypothetical protein ACE5K3_03105 [bacterium]